MARKPRVHYPSALYHVILRGNAGQSVFFNDKDRYHFYSLLQEGVEQYNHRIHAFCLMKNHIHLAVQVENIPLSRIFQNVCFRYTRWINRRQGRTGHLFQGRYKAILVDADSYLLELIRYIHLNPVRSGIVKEPKSYLWSGHRTYLGIEKTSWLATDWVLSQFSQRLDHARKAYEKFINDGIGIGRQQEYYSGSTIDHRILGDDKFIDKVLGNHRMRLKQNKDLNEIVLKVCNRFAIKEKDLSASGKDHKLSKIRGIVAWVVLESGNSTLSELSKLIKRDATTLSSAAKRIQILSNSDRKLAHLIAELLEEVG